MKLEKPNERYQDKRAPRWGKASNENSLREQRRGTRFGNTTDALTAPAAPTP